MALTKVTYSMIEGAPIYAADYGIDTTGVIDSTTQLQSAIDAAANKTLVLSGTIKVTASLVINNPINIIGEFAKIDATSSQFTVISIRSNDVTIDGLEIEGAGNGAYDTNGRLIYALGTDNGAATAPTYLSSIVVKNCKLYNSGRSAIRADYVDNFTALNNTIYNIGYSGFEGVSCKNSNVSNCTIYDITPGSSSNMYGAYWSQTNSSDTVRYPVCDTCTFESNHVSNVNWEGLDTHGGRQIFFRNNVIVNCKSGIVITRADDSSGNTVTCSIRNYVTGNTIDTCTTAIAVGSLDSATDSIYHTGTNISNNFVRNCGVLGSNTNTGAINIWKTAGAIVSNNVISFTIGNGICLRNDCLNTVINGNNVQDVVSESSATPCAAILVYGDNSTGVIGNNCLTAYSTAVYTYKNLHGMYVTSGLTNTQFSINDNYFEDAVTAQYSISSTIAATYTAPRKYREQVTFTTTTGVSTLNTTVTLPSTMSANTLYQVLASLATTTMRNVRTRAARVSTNQIIIYLETTDGTNFSTAESVTVYYEVVGF